MSLELLGAGPPMKVAGMHGTYVDGWNHQQPVTLKYDGTGQLRWYTDSGAVIPDNAVSVDVTTPVVSPVVALLALGGSVAGAVFWPAHRVIGFVLGGLLGGGVGSALTGKAGA